MLQHEENMRKQPVSGYYIVKNIEHGQLNILRSSGCMEYLAAGKRFYGETLESEEITV